MITMDKKGYRLAQMLKSAGKKKVMMPAIRIPMRKGLAISARSWP
jgi:hypothetical protein